MKMGYKFDNIEHPYFKETLETGLGDRYQQYLKYALNNISQDENIGKYKDGKINKRCHNTKERFIKILKERNKGLTLEEIGETLNLSKERIRQIEKKALGKICLPSFYEPILDELLLGEYKKIEEGILSNKYGDKISIVYKLLKKELNKTIEELNTLEDRVKKLTEAEEAIKKQKLLEKLSKPIELLDMSFRTANCMRVCRIKYVGDIVQKTESELLKKKNFGMKSLNEIKCILAKMDLSLDMKVKEQYCHNDIKLNEFLQEFLDKNIDESELPHNIISILKNNSISKIGYLVEIKESDLSSLIRYDLETKHTEYIGNEGVHKIKKVLSKYGLSLGMKINRYYI